MAYNPDEPRDEAGKWTDMPDGSRAPASSYVRGVRVTTDEAIMLQDYQSGSEPFNNWLRGVRGARARNPGQIPAKLDALLARVEPTTADLTVYRAFDISHAFIDRSGFMYDKGFLSTSMDQSISRNFLSDYAKPGMLEIKIPRGSRVLRLKSGAATEFGYEKEVILPRNAKIKVTSVKREPVRQLGLIVRYKATYVPDKRYKG